MSFDIMNSDMNSRAEKGYNSSEKSGDENGDQDMEEMLHSSEDDRADEESNKRRGDRDGEENLNTSKKAKVFVEGEAELSDDGNGEKSEDEDESGADDYEKDGFVVDSEDEGGSDSDANEEKKVKRKRFRKTKRAMQMTDDDLSLVKEAKKMMGEVIEEDDDGDNNVEEQHIESENESLSDSEADFIVDDVTNKKSKGRKVSFEEEQLEEQDNKYLELFGFSAREFEDTNKSGHVAEEEDMEKEWEDERQARSKLVDQKSTKKALESMFDFTSRAASYALDDDLRIRQNDIPERYQTTERRLGLNRDERYKGEFFLRDPAELDRLFSFNGKERSKLPSNAALDINSNDASLFDGSGRISMTSESAQRRAQALWVCAQLRKAYCNRGGSAEELPPDSDIVEPIQRALLFLQQNEFEVPFIYVYRYHRIEPLTLEDLWTILELSRVYVNIVKLRIQILEFASKIPDSVVDDEIVNHELIGQLGETGNLNLSALDVEKSGIVKPWRETFVAFILGLEPDDLTLEFLRDVNGYLLFKFGETNTNHKSKTLSDRKKKKTKKSKKKALPAEVMSAKISSEASAEIDALFNDSDHEDNEEQTAEPIEEGNSSNSSDLDSSDSSDDESEDEDELGNIDEGDEEVEQNQQALLDYQRERAHRREEASKRRIERERSRVIKRQTRRGNLDLLNQYKLKELCDAICSVPRFAACVSSGLALFPVVEHDLLQLNPQSLAMAAQGEFIPSAEAAIATAVQNIAREMVTEPRIRMYLRNIYREQGKLSTKLTVRGRSLVASDPSHEYYSVSNIHGKPFKCFLKKPASDMGIGDFRDQALLIDAAEKDQLLHRVINTAELEHHMMVFFAPFLMSSDGAEKVKTLVQIDENEVEVSTSVAIASKEKKSICVMPSEDLFSDWDKLRYSVLRMAVSRFMVKYIHDAMFDEMLLHARAHVCRASSESLWELATAAPIRFPMRHPRVSIPTNRYVRPSHIRVMGVFLTEDTREPGYAAALSGDGDVVDYEKLPSILRRSDLDLALQAIVDRSKPHIICLNSSAGSRVRWLLNDLERQVSERIERLADDGYDDGADSIMERAWINSELIFAPLVIDDKVAIAISNGHVRTKEFDQFHINLRRAITLGRYVRDPLPELCSIFSDYTRSDVGKLDQNEIFTLGLHRCLSRVPPQQALRSLEAALVSAVSVVGVDLNRCMKHSFLKSLIPFVPGLGHRKASYMVQSLAKTHSVIMDRRSFADVVSGTMKVSRVKETAAGDDDSVEEADDGNGDDDEYENCLTAASSSICFRNCAGFLRVGAKNVDFFDEDDFHYDDDEVYGQNYLDVTRISPELQQIGIYLCWEALNPGKPSPEMDTDGKMDFALHKCIKKVMKSSRRKLDSVISSENPFFSSDRSSRLWRPFVDFESSSLRPFVGSLLDGNASTQGKVQNPRERRMYCAENEACGDSLLDGDLVSKVDIVSAEADLCAVLGESLIDKEQISLCVNEIRFPYASGRWERTPLDDEALFDLLVEEDGSPLVRGMDITARFTGFRGRWLEFQLPSGFRGSMHFTNVCDGYIPHNLSFPTDRSGKESTNDDRREYERSRTFREWLEDTQKLYIGSSITARILDLKKERWSVELSAKPSLLARQQTLGFSDPFWKRPETLKERRSTRRNKNCLSNGVTKRHITHEAFKNITSNEAEQQLAGSGVGSYVIRPSSAGINYISVTWKVSDDPIPLFQHITVQEFGKKPNDASLGSRLKLKDQEFEDLDDLLMNHVVEMGSFVKELYGYDKFKNVSQSEIQQVCSDEKKSNPKRIPYYIIPFQGSPGYFILVYQPGSSLKKAKIGISSSGFRLDDKVFNNIGDMIAYFKSNFQNIGQTRYRSNASGRYIGNREHHDDRNYARKGYHRPDNYYYGGRNDSRSDRYYRPREAYGSHHSR